MLWLEAAATIHFLRKHINSKADCINEISKRKSHISIDIIKNAYNHLLNYGLINERLDDLQINDKNEMLEGPENLKTIKIFLESRINKLMEYFNTLDVNKNKIFLSGSLDYLLIVLEKENIVNPLKLDLYDFFNKYITNVESIQNIIKPDTNILEKIDLTKLETDFDLLQDYVSQELEIFPRLDDKNQDLKLLFS